MRKSVLQYQSSEKQLKSTHSLTDKIPDSGSGAGGSIPSGCIDTIKMTSLLAEMWQEVLHYRYAVPAKYAGKHG